MNSELIRKNKYIIIVIVLIFGIGAGTLGYFQYKKNINPTPSVSPTASAIPSNSPILTPTPIKEVWETYTNPLLGFLIKYPQVLSINKYPSNKLLLVPIKIIEDEENKITFIVKYSYGDENEKNIYSLESFRNEIKQQREKGKGSPSYTSGLGWAKPLFGWAILIRDIKSDNELSKFIKDNYGPGCLLGSRKPWKQDGVYEIEIKGEDWDKGADLGSTTCNWSSVKALLYAPQKNKFMSVNLGQECTFQSNTDSQSYKCYDEEMINSLKFK